MAKELSAWYDKKWVMPVLSILGLVFMLFREEIRGAIVRQGVTVDDRWFDMLLAGAFIGLVGVLASKSDRATRACTDLRAEFQEDLARHRKDLNHDLDNYRKQLQTHLDTLVDSRLRQIYEGVGTLDSKLSAVNSRIDALDSRITALTAVVSARINSP